MGRIVVGVDGSPEAEAALRWAVGEAVLRGAGVEAWHAWHATSNGAGAPPDERALESAARAALDRTVGAVDASGLSEPVQRVLVRAVPVSALLDVARTADLLVVGAAGSRDASFAPHVVRHAPCPVVVVPA
jgi:nucleotide-binding universal stress UspA family protein